jgi:hypothetical protein
MGVFIHPLLSRATRVCKINIILQTFSGFSWYVNFSALSASIVSTTIFNGANKGMVAVTGFTDVSFTRVEMVKFVFALQS